MSKDVITYKGKAAFVVIFLAVVFVVAIQALPAFLIMLALGALHSMWPVVPALGFWATYLIILIVSLVGSFLRS